MKHDCISHLIEITIAQKTIDHLQEVKEQFKWKRYIDFVEKISRYNAFKSPLKLGLGSRLYFPIG